MNRRERTELQKEQRRLGYRIIVGTIRPQDRVRLAEIKLLLGDTEQPQSVADHDQHNQQQLSRVRAGDQ